VARFLGPTALPDWPATKQTRQRQPGRRHVLSTRGLLLLPVTRPHSTVPVPSSPLSLSPVSPAPAPSAAPVCSSRPGPLALHNRFSSYIDLLTGESQMPQEEQRTAATDKNGPPPSPICYSACPCPGTDFFLLALPISLV
jgi:hypothetical protein